MCKLMARVRKFLWQFRVSFRCQVGRVWNEYLRA